MTDKQYQIIFGSLALFFVVSAVAAAKYDKKGGKKK